MRVSTRFDLANEQSFPVASLFHRLDGTLLAGLHPWNCVLVHRHSVSLASPHHVEPQVREAAPAVFAVSFRTSSSDGHKPSMSAPLLVTKLVSVRRARSSRVRLPDEISFL